MSDWLDGQLADSIASLDAGVSVNAEDRPHGAGEIGVLKTSAVSGGAFLPDQNKSVVERERRLVSEPVQGDSIIVSRMNTPALVGESCYVRNAYPTLFLPDRLWQLKPKNSANISMRWLSFVLQSAAYRRHVEVHATGTSGSMKNLPKSKLLALPVSYPRQPEQTKIAQVLDTLDTAIHETKAIIAKLKAVKQGLLHDLLTRGIDANGELRPPQTEAPRLYKESPLGWIPKEWDAAKLSKSITLISGQHIEAELCNSVGRGVPYFTGPSDFLGGGTVVTQYTTRPQIMCDEADILITVKGSGCGKVAISDVQACISRQLMAIKVPARALQYWFAVFQSLQETFNRMATGGNIPGISRAQILELLVATPNAIEEMEAIGNRIQSSNARLESEQLTLEKLKLEKTGLMDDLLTGRVRVTPLLAEAAQQQGSA